MNKKRSEKRKEPSASKPRILDRNDRKELRKKRRESRPHYDIVSELNSIFQVSISQLNKKQRNEKIDQIIKKCHGKIGYVITKHDASRVFQAIIKYGLPKHRELILNEICTKTKDKDQQHDNNVKSDLLSTCMDSYGYRVILKLLQHTNYKILVRILDELILNVRKLSLHMYGSLVLDYIYANGKNKERVRILQQLYGVEFSIFQSGGIDSDNDDDNNDNNNNNNDDDESNMDNEEKKHINNITPVPGRNVAQICSKQPLKKNSLLNNIRKTLDKSIEKELLNRRYLHTLLREYLENCNDNDKETMIDSINELGLILISSKDGSIAFCHCIAQSTPKQRKQIMKSMKGSVIDICTSTYGYLSIIRALNTIDDTVLLNKIICTELINTLTEKTLTKAQQQATKTIEGTGLSLPKNQNEISIFENINAGKVILYILAPASNQYFSVEEVAILTAPALSKKPAERRQLEILKKLLPPLCKKCIEDMNTLVYSKNGWRILYEVMKAIQQHHEFDKKNYNETLQKNLVKCYIDDTNDQPLIETPIGHYLIKFLLNNLQPNSIELSNYFWDAFKTATRKDHTKWLNYIITTNRGAFTLSFIFEKCSNEIKEEMSKILHSKELFSLIKKNDNHGGKHLKKLLES